MSEWKSLKPYGTKTKKSKLEYYRNLFKKGHTNSLKTARPADYEDFKELFNVHPNKEKISKMVDIAIKSNPMYPNTDIIYIIDEDGNYDTVSYKTAFESKKPKYSYIGILMRNLIQSQTYSFFNNNKQECELCEYNGAHLAVDHFQIPFIKLRDDFLSERKVPIINQTDDGGNPILDDDNEEHVKFRKEWLIYHQENAKLRILCRSCNCSMGDYGYRKSKLK